MAHAGPCNFNHILTDKNERQKFCTWFWNSSNGNDLIAILNSSCHLSGSKIRRCDGWWPHIYCVVSNENNVPGISRDGEIEWKYCKVGITGNDTTTGTNNRMETVEREIKKVTKKAKTIFVLPVKATDSRPNTVIEKSVREQIGIPVSKDLAHYRRLPYPTEWVLVAQSHLTNIRTKINENKGKQKMDTGLLWEVQQTIEHTENEGNLPRNLKLQDGEVHRARKYMVREYILPSIVKSY